MPSAIEIADSLEASLRDAFLAMVEVVAQTVPADQLDEWLERRDIVAIINAFSEAISQLAITPAVSDLTATYANLVGQSVRASAAGFINTATFQLTSPVVIDRLRRQAARLVVGVGQDSILSLRTILEQGYVEGWGFRAAGRIIRSVIGLLPQHAGAVGKYAQALSQVEMPEERRANLVETYSRRLLAYRAENIARTETIAAVHAGHVEGWIELANRGVIERHRTRVEWVVTEDDRLCPWCAPMDGRQVELGGLFMATHKGFPEGKPTAVGPGSRRVNRSLRPDPRSQPRDERGRFVALAKRDNRDHLDGRLVPLPRPIIVAHPPLHPSCRCTLALRFLP